MRPIPLAALAALWSGVALAQGAAGSAWVATENSHD
jgi:hypothetical protein